MLQLNTRRLRVIRDRFPPRRTLPRRHKQTVLPSQSNTIRTFKSQCTIACDLNYPCSPFAWFGVHLYVISFPWLEFITWHRISYSAQLFVAPSRRSLRSNYPQIMRPVAFSARPPNSAHHFLRDFDFPCTVPAICVFLDLVFKSRVFINPVRATACVCTTV